MYIENTCINIQIYIYIYIYYVLHIYIYIYKYTHLTNIALHILVVYILT